MTDYGNWEMILTSWTTPTQNITLLLNIWLWTKLSTSQWKGKFQTQHKRFGIKIYKLCDKTGYTYCMEVYLGKDRTRPNADMTTHATVKRFTTTKIKVNGHGHSLYTDNISSSPDLCENLTRQKISCCGTVHTKRKGMPHDMTKQTTEMWR
jgi:hypothetical protein